jgi:hypothetical protein
MIERKHSYERNAYQPAYITFSVVKSITRKEVAYFPAFTR